MHEQLLKSELSHFQQRLNQLRDQYKKINHFQLRAATEYLLQSFKQEFNPIIWALTVKDCHGILLKYIPQSGALYRLIDEINRALAGKHPSSHDNYFAHNIKKLKATFLEFANKAESFIKYGNELKVASRYLAVNISEGINIVSYEARTKEIESILDRIPNTHYGKQLLQALIHRGLDIISAEDMVPRYLKNAENQFFMINSQYRDLIALHRRLLQSIHTQLSHNDPLKIAIEYLKMNLHEHETKASFHGKYHEVEGFINLCRDSWARDKLKAVISDIEETLATDREMALYKANGKGGILLNQYEQFMRDRLGCKEHIPPSVKLKSPHAKIPSS